MKVLLTGAQGMVGRNLLADPGAGAHDILTPRHQELDLTDAGATLAYVLEAAPDLIIHTAGVVGGIQANIEAPARFLHENLAIGLSLIGAAHRARVPRLVNLASSCMYPRDAPDGLAETMLMSGPLEPTNEGYALAKIAGWKLTLTLGRAAPGRAWRTLIPPNLYGPHDHFEPDRSHLVAAAIRKVDQALTRGSDEVEIWGDGEARREFMFAPDLADFIWGFHDRLEELPETLNVGVGEDASINEYYAEVAAVMGFQGRFRHDLSRPVGMRRKRLDVSAQTRLGWRPPTPLADGLAATAAFYRQIV